MDCVSVCCSLCRHPPVVGTATAAQLSSAQRRGLAAHTPSTPRTRPSLAMAEPAHLSAVSWKKETQDDDASQRRGVAAGRRAAQTKKCAVAGCARSLQSGTSATSAERPRDSAHAFNSYSYTSLSRQRTDSLRLSSCDCHCAAPPLPSVFPFVRRLRVSSRSIIFSVRPSPRRRLRILPTFVSSPPTLCRRRRRTVWDRCRRRSRDPTADTSCWQPSAASTMSSYTITPSAPATPPHGSTTSALCAATPAPCTT